VVKKDALLKKANIFRKKKYFLFKINLEFLPIKTGTSLNFKIGLVSLHTNPDALDLICPGIECIIFSFKSLYQYSVGFATNEKQCFFSERFKVFI
jgi:hypothetical protein